MAQLNNLFSSLIDKFSSAKSSRPSVGLDIGVSSCRMVELISRADGYEVLSFAVEPVIAADVVKAIRSVMSKVSQPNVSPVTALRGKGTLIRFVDMPKMPLADLKRSFAFEVDKYFPFPKDQIFSDCCILDPQGADNKFPVLVAAAKKELVNERMKLLSEAGLQADFMTLNSIAVANVFHVLGALQSPADTLAGGKKAVAILDIGEVVTNLTIFVDSRPKFNRDIFIGGRDFTKSISNALRITFDEAEKMKKDPKDRAGEISASLESVAFDLVSEVRLSFDYFVTESNLSLGQLFLTGGATSMEHLRQVLSKQLEIETLVWNPFRNLKFAPNVSSGQIGDNAGHLATALGLALYS